VQDRVGAGVRDEGAVPVDQNTEGIRIEPATVRIVGHFKGQKVGKGFILPAPVDGTDRGEIRAVRAEAITEDIPAAQPEHNGQLSVHKSDVMHAQNGRGYGTVAGPDGGEARDDAARLVEEFRISGNAAGMPDAVDLTVGARRARAIVSGHLSRLGDQHNVEEFVVEHTSGRVETLGDHRDNGAGTGVAVSGGRIRGNHQAGYQDTCRERG